MSSKKAKGLSITLISCVLTSILFQNCLQTETFEITSTLGESTLPSTELPSDIHIEYPGTGNGNNSGVTPINGKVAQSPMLMDRKLLYSTLQKIFGPSISKIANVASITHDYSVFGGSCSLYSQAKNQTAPLDKCNNSEDILGVKPYSSVNVLRQGRLNQICLELTKTNSESLTFLLGSIDKTRSIPDAKYENALKLFQSFYSDHPTPKEELLNAIIDTIGETNSTAGWSNAAYGTCISGYWQVL